MGNGHNENPTSCYFANQQPVPTAIALVFVALRLIVEHVEGIFRTQVRVVRQVGQVGGVPLKWFHRIKEQEDHAEVRSVLDHRGTVYHVRLQSCMLADGARVGGYGKLYIFGGQWDRLFAPSVPARHPIIGIGLVVELAYHEALKDHPVEITLRDADGSHVGPKAVLNLRVGHPVGLEPASSVFVPIALEMPQIEFPQYGRYEWVVEMDGETEGRLPLTVAPPPGPVLSAGPAL